MGKKIIDKRNEFGDMLISALRYSLGRKTYITSTTSEFIIDNLPILKEKELNVMLRDLNEYFNDRAKGLIHDDSCDVTSWTYLETKIRKRVEEILENGNN